MQRSQHPHIAAVDAKVASLEASLAGLQARCAAAGDDVPEQLAEDIEVAQAALVIARRRRGAPARALAGELLQSSPTPVFGMD